MAQQKPKELRVGNILAAAIDEFSKKGYEGASMDAIASRAGVSKGGLYYHFSNKEHLLMEVNNKLNEPVLEMMENAMAGADPKASLRTYMVEYLRYWISRPKELGFLFLSMSKSLESPVLSDYYRQSVEGSVAFFVHMIDKVKGDCGSHAESEAIAIMGALDGMVSYAVVHPELQVEDLAETVIRAVEGLEE